MRTVSSFVVMGIALTIFGCATMSRVSTHPATAKQSSFRVPRSPSAGNRTVASAKTTYPVGLIEEEETTIPDGVGYRCQVSLFNGTVQPSMTLLSRFFVDMSRNTQYVGIFPPGDAACNIVEESPKSGIVFGFEADIPAKKWWQRKAPPAEISMKFYRRTGDAIEGYGPGRSIGDKNSCGFVHSWYPNRVQEEEMGGIEAKGTQTTEQHLSTSDSAYFVRLACTQTDER